MQRGQDIRREGRPVGDEGLEEPQPGRFVWSQQLTRLVDGSVQESSGSIVEGMSCGDDGVDIFQSMLGQWQGLKERRGDRHGMDGRTDIVGKARQGQPGTAQSAAKR